MFHSNALGRNEWIRASLAVFASLIAASFARADDAVVATVLDDLQRPCGIAVRLGGTADRYELFIAESGAGRVERWSNLTPDERQSAITGFPTRPANHATRQTGPLSLIFLDPSLLVVGTSFDDGQGLLRIYELPEGDEVLPADRPRERPAGGPGKQLAGGEPACTALTRTRANEFVPDALISVVRGPNGGGWLFKSRIQAGLISALKSFHKNEAALKNTFAAVSVSPMGHIVAVENGEDGAGARIRFFNPIDGSTELEMPIDLSDVVALAYSPTSGSLYAADFSGGIFRLDDASEPGQPACRATKIAGIGRPTALAFAPDGALYVVTFGSSESDGTLQVITGDL